MLAMMLHRAPHSGRWRRAGALVGFSSIAAFALPGFASREDTQPSIVARDRVRTCGLGREFHAGRRAALVAKLEDGVVLVRGLPATRDYTRFQQDKIFWYLTGVESPGATLVIDVKTKTEILFLPKANAMSELWEGEIMDASDAWVGQNFGFDDVRPANELMDSLKELVVGEKPVWISKAPHVALSGCHDRAFPADRAVEKDPLDGRASREDALASNLEEKFECEVRDFAPILAEIRRVKTPVEIDAMRRAGRAGSAAMVEAIRSTRPGQGEWEIEALMTFVHRREGAEGPAYHAIVGSGTNALVLHYSAVSRQMQAGEMLLIDYAPEYDHYTSDITRSWPVDGRFTDRMAEIYDAVLAAQEAGIAAVAPGKTLAEIDKVCRKVLQSRGMGKLMPHGACHYIGLEVHDVGEFAKPLVPGVAFTVEPGVYEPATGIGVRIEDVVVVTQTGCEVLTADVPKARKSIEELWSEPGLLERGPLSANRETAAEIGVEALKRGR